MTISNEDLKRNTDALDDGSISLNEFIAEMDKAFFRETEFVGHRYGIPYWVGPLQVETPATMPPSPISNLIDLHLHCKKLAESDEPFIISGD